VDVHFHLPWGMGKPDPQTTLGLSLSLASALSRRDFMPGVREERCSAYPVTTADRLHSSIVKTLVSTDSAVRERMAGLRLHKSSVVFTGRCVLGGAGGGDRSGALGWSPPRQLPAHGARRGDRELRPHPSPRGGEGYRRGVAGLDDEYDSRPGEPDLEVVGARSIPEVLPLVLYGWDVDHPEDEREEEEEEEQRQEGKGPGQEEGQEKGNGVVETESGGVEEEQEEKEETPEPDEEKKGGEMEVDEHEEGRGEEGGMMVEVDEDVGTRSLSSWSSVGQMVRGVYAKARDGARKVMGR
jgi:hypothetical protein